MSVKGVVLACSRSCGDQRRQWTAQPFTCFGRFRDSCSVIDASTAAHTRLNVRVNT